MIKREGWHEYNVRLTLLSASLYARQHWNEIFFFFRISLCHPLLFTLVKNIFGIIADPVIASRKLTWLFFSPTGRMQFSDWRACHIEIQESKRSKMKCNQSSSISSVVGVRTSTSGENIQLQPTARLRFLTRNAKFPLFFRVLWGRPAWLMSWVDE